jgi:hypothetical protein
MIDRWPVAGRTALAGAIVGAVLLPVAIIGGHGNTTLLRLLFPLALYFGDWTHSEFCTLMAAIIQWPIYGAVLGWAINKRSIFAWPAVMAVSIVHVVLAWSLG